MGSESNWPEAKSNRNYHTEADHKIVSVFMRDLGEKWKKNILWIYHKTSKEVKEKSRGCFWKEGLLSVQVIFKITKSKLALKNSTFYWGEKKIMVIKRSGSF